jgi:hypothetical protein
MFAQRADRYLHSSFTVSLPMACLFGSVGCVLAASPADTPRSRCLSSFRIDTVGSLVAHTGWDPTLQVTARVA